MRPFARFTLVLICLSLVSYAAAATYYVDAGGNDANPGTSAQPWRTIQKAANTAAAGDTVIVRAGTYNERVYVSRSGTSSAPIRFTADGTVYTGGFSLRASYVHVIGFRITAVAARYSVDGAGVYATGAGCRVENNVITRTGYYGIHFDIGSSRGVIKGNLVDQCALAGINFHGTNHLVEGNEIRDIRVSMAGNTYGDADGFNIFESGHVIRGNYVHSISLSANAGYTPHIDGVHSWHSGKFVRMSDCVFEQNVFDLPETTSTNHTAGFMIEGDPQNIIIRNNIIRATRAVHFVTGTNVRVLNNTLAGRLSWPTDRNPAGIYFEQTSSSIIRNNLIVDFPWYAVYISGNTGMTIGNNCTWNSDGTRPRGTAQSGDLWGINPRVVSLSGFDFHLQSDSPCRDAGATLSDVTNDFDGLPRPYGTRHDIGAFEYSAGGSAVNQAPTASFTASPESGEAPLAVAFDGRASSDPEGAIASYAWSFGDGTSGSGATVSHSYTAAGTFTARLTVTDGGGLSASASRTITVTAPATGGGDGATYYVATDGNDANPGTSALPWRTIQKAAGSVSAGDAVIVRAGSYAERVSISRSGTSTAPIAFSAEGSVQTRGFSIRADYVRVKGFGCTSTGAMWSNDAAGIYVLGTGCRLEDNAVSQTAYYGILLDPASRSCVVARNYCDRAAMTGIVAHGAGHLVEGNEIEDTRCAMGGNVYGDADGMRIFGSGHTIRGNLIHNITLEANAGYSPHIDGFQSWQGTGFVVATDCVFERNLIDLPIATSTTHSAGFMFENVPRNIIIRNNIIRAGRAVHFLTGDGIRLLNNTLIGSLAWPTGHNPAGIYFEQTSSSLVRNNLVMDFPWNAIYISGNTGLTIGYNCTWNSNGTMPRGTAQTGDLWGVDPRVVSLSGFDFHLRSDSPCRDTAASTSHVTDDFDGLARPYGAGIDIGAFEYRPSATENQPPTASFTASPSSGEAPLDVTFDGRASSDSEGAIASYAWEFGDGSTGSGATVSHSYTAAGTFTARLTVTDGGGLSASASRTITVSAAAANQPPTASFTASPEGGTVPLTITFDARASADPDGGVVSYAWDFGDGKSGSGAVVSHKYTAVGTFTVRLTVRDGGGLSASATRTVTLTRKSSLTKK